MAADQAGIPDPSDLITLDGRQRMVPTDTAALECAVDQLRALLSKGSGFGETGRELVLLRRAGVALVALNRPTEAAPLLERAIRLAASTGRPRAEVAARLNLGDAHRYAGNLTAAAAQYQRALQLARKSAPSLLDFALQHRGKYLIEQGRPEQAVGCLEEALRLRVAKGDPTLIESTMAALALARDHGRVGGSATAGSGTR